MSRSERHLKIIDLINKNDINTQEELVKLLNSNNFKVTQATVSRDIKELGLIKIMTEDKKYRYTYVKSEQSHAQGMMLNLFKETVISIEAAQNIIVIKCIPAGASTSAAMIDKLDLPNIIGTLAGDDTVLVIVNNIMNVSNVLSRLKQLTY